MGPQDQREKGEISPLSPSLAVPLTMLGKVASYNYIFTKFLYVYQTILGPFCHNNPSVSPREKSTYAPLRFQDWYLSRLLNLSSKIDRQCCSIQHRTILISLAERETISTATATKWLVTAPVSISFAVRQRLPVTVELSSARQSEAWSGLTAAKAIWSAANLHHLVTDLRTKQWPTTVSP